MKNTLRKLRCLAALLPLSVMSVQAQTLPVPDHIVLVIFENHGYSIVMNATRAPHMMAWAADTNAAVFSNLTAMTHPSQPNYLYLFSGSAQGNTDDGIPVGQPFTTPNLAAELAAASRSFITYSEDMPSVGYNGGGYSTGGANYARKHNPAANWMGTGANQLPITTNQPFTAFPNASNYASLPTVSYVIPNQDNDMHDGNYFTTITTGDTWIYNHLDSFRQWALANNSLLIITYDEDEGLNGNKVATIFYGPMVKGGTYNNKENLVNILGTMETMYGLGHAGAPFPGSINDSAITYCWKTIPVVDSTGTLAVTNLADRNEFTISPNPAHDHITFSCRQPLNAAATIEVLDVNGRVAGKYTMSGDRATVNTAGYAAGLYYYKVYNAHGLLNEGKFIVDRH